VTSGTERTSTLSETNNKNHFETLQISPAAEPEVIAAAYRALARKYHPDRSEAPDAMVRMAQINVAFQALHARIGRPSGGGFSAQDSPSRSTTPLTPTQIDPNASLEDILAAISGKIAAARQHVIDEITRDGLERDLAVNLVNSALRTELAGAKTSANGQSRTRDVHLSPDSSYDDALALVTEKAKAARNRLADELVKDGLNRNAAVELSDQAFERIRQKTGNSARTDLRLTQEHVDLNASLDSGVRVVANKLRTARQLVLDELTRDGVPLRTAEQLLDTATRSIMPGQRR